MTDSNTAQAYAEGFTRGLIAGLGPLIVVGLILSFFWIRYPNNFKLVIAQIWSILSYVLGVFADRHYVSKHIEGKVGKGIDNITSKIDGLEAEQIKITLVRSAKREAFIKDRVLLMRIQKKDNQEENLTNIAHLYSQHLYSRIQPLLNKIQKEGIQLYTTKSILKTGGGEGLTYLDEKYYRPLIIKHPDLQLLLNQLEVIDSKGLFYSIFIQEMVFLGEKAMFRRNVKGIHKEISDFIQFLIDFANRSRGDDSSEKNFKSANIKMSFILVALREKRDARDTESYINYVKKYLPRDTESFYFMGWGDNVNFVRRVVKEVVASVDYLVLKKEKGYERFFEDGGRVDAISILARNDRIATLV